MNFLFDLGFVKACGGGGAWIMEGWGGGVSVVVEYEREKRKRDEMN